MALEGLGPEEKLNATQIKALEGKTASHLMFGFAGAERNCNPWHVREGGWGAWILPCLPIRLGHLLVRRWPGRHWMRTRAGWAACTTG
jgi:hypothetical protein